MQIYLARNNVQAGPYSLDQLNAMLANGDVLLDDLMWHEGMANWQRLGEVTGNQLYYSPSGDISAINSVTAVHSPQSASPSASTSTDRVSVERLFGKPEAPRDQKSPSSQPHSANRSPVSLGKFSSQSNRALSNAATGAQPVILAPIMSRILALAINAVLYMLSILPVVIAFTKLDIDMEKFQSLTDFNAAYEYSVGLMQSIPDSTILASQLMMFGLFAIQLLLIIRRGQSLGKMMTGIRVVDQQTHRLPPMGRLVGMRTLFLVIVYNLIFSMTSVLGFAVIAVHYFMASKSPEKIGLHDRLAKTLVVKASDEQLNKLP